MTIVSKDERSHFFWLRGSRGECRGTVAGQYEDFGQIFLFLTKIKVSGIFCSPANEDIAMNPMANSPNFILSLRKIFSDFSINHFYL